MSALGQKQTFAVQNGMSPLPPIADIRRCKQHVRFVPKADIEVDLASSLKPAKSVTRVVTLMACFYLLI